MDSYPTLAAVHSVLAPVLSPAPSSSKPPLSSLAHGPVPPLPQQQQQQQQRHQSNQPPVAPQHKRVYQACISCRRRKVRCDLGSVDNPHDPPCVRCRRESKECYFSATRRKRRVDDASDDLPDDPEHDDYTQRNGRKQKRVRDSPITSVIDRDHSYGDAPLTPGGSEGRRQPLRRPGDDLRTSPLDGQSRRRGAGEFGDEDVNAPLENLEARSVMRKEVYGPADALELLYKAATDNPAQKMDEPCTSPDCLTQSNGGNTRPDVLSRTASRSYDQESDKGAARQWRPRHEGSMEHSIDPELRRRDRSLEPGYAEALKAWSRFRFVRAGWFTAQEAMEYIDYYYEYLSPLTPISPPTFRSPTLHLSLLTEEPILTVTLLTIASRHRVLPGTGGHCRSHAIHGQLWGYLHGMIERVIWGQEAFGGGFCGSGADENQNSSTAPWRGLRRGSLRTLGTIESLMILTEWHPRALHFPPAEATDELMVPLYDKNTSPAAAEAEDNQGPPAGFGGRRIESWLEPAWRSDRMCWMLLNAGIGLAYELGVFDDIDQLLAEGAIARPEYEEENYRLRAHRIKRLLLVYMSQLAGRLGWTNMMPDHMRKVDPKRRPTSAVEGHAPGTNISSFSTTLSYVPDVELDDQIIHFWWGIANAMRLGNEKLFRSRKHTTDIIQNGQYIGLLKEFQPMLRDWWKEFERYRMPQYMRHILAIEFEYVRIYINSLSLQAVVERCTNNAATGSNTGPNKGQSGHPTSHLSPQTQMYYGKLPLGQLGGFGVEDQEYVKEVINGSRNLLQTVVDGLLPGDYLKHAPVRTYFRIISGAMFLLKTFALGAPRSDVELSIGLMDRTVDALRNCVVDDVHLGIRFADMLETLTSRLRNRFIHAPAISATGDDRSSDRNDAHEAAHGTGLNGNAHHADAWAKAREGHSGLDRTGTPVNVSARPWDLSTGGSFPYPSSSQSILNSSATAGVNCVSGPESHQSVGTSVDSGVFGTPTWNDPTAEMWYLPPGPAFFQNMGDSAVAMTAEGVNVGGLDLLEYMAMDPLDSRSYNVLEGSHF